MAKIYYQSSTLEKIARKILLQYDPDFFKREPQAVPVEHIIESVGLNIDYMRLTIDGDELGRMIYDDGYTTRYNPEKDDYELVWVSEGTMLIESLLVNDSFQHGRYRFTLGHELGHWVLHKRLYKGTGSAAATYRTDYIYNDTIEWQANYIAKSILMPAKHIIRCCHELREAKADEKIYILADVFEVSKQAMEIRLNELGLI